MEVNKHERKSRFDDAEADVDREPWLFREADGPNPLTIEATDWSTGHTKLGEAEFLNGTDREGKKWSVLVGSRIMQKHLIEGLVEEWDGEAGEFVVVETQGRVKPGEFVSIKYLGDRKGSKYDYPDFRISRKPPLQVEKPAHGGHVRLRAGLGRAKGRRHSLLSAGPAAPSEAHRGRGRLRGARPPGLPLPREGAAD